MAKDNEEVIKVVSLRLEEVNKLSLKSGLQETEVRRAFERALAKVYRA